MRDVTLAPGTLEPIETASRDEAAAALEHAAKGSIGVTIRVEVAPGAVERSAGKCADPAAQVRGASMALRAMASLYQRPLAFTVRSSVA
ncbi:hypothetical protein [Dactylosporangium sp. NPDC051484]|uniref:hypothetical protein n=1 Tax=Dactylosporangium sp. NPDC051484 TaxID=3154942 RepID=UPI003450EA85